MRRLAFIGAIVIVLVGVSLALYFVLFTGGPNTPSDTPRNPFDGTDAPNTPGGVDGNEDQGPLILAGAGEELAPRFVKITDGPVAFGTVAYLAPTTTPAIDNASTTALAPVPEKDYEVRFVERSSGNVYAYLANERTLTRVSNRTIPGVQEVAWLSDGSIAYLRYLATVEGAGEYVETYALPVGEEGGYFLEKNLSQILARGENALLTLLPSSSGALGSIVRSDGTSTAAFSSTLGSVRAGFAGNSYVVTTKAAASLDGYSFLIGSAGTSSRVLGPLKGLSVLASPSGESLLYSYTNRGSLSLAILDLETRSSTALPLNTLADKCVWTMDETAIYCAVPRSTSGTLPDAWYQGTASLSDRIWKVSLAERVASLAVDPATLADTAVDVVALTLDQGANILVFTDKKTGALFLYDL